MVSSTATRSGAIPSTAPPSRVRPRSSSRRRTTCLAVAFYVDDPSASRLPYSLDILAPFDLGGTKTNGQANLVRLKRGTRTVTARLVFADGFVDVVSATFTASG